MLPTLFPPTPVPTKVSTSALGAKPSGEAGGAVVDDVTAPPAQRWTGASSTTARTARTPPPTPRGPEAAATAPSSASETLTGRACESHRRARYPARSPSTGSRPHRPRRHPSRRRSRSSGPSPPPRHPRDRRRASTAPTARPATTTADDRGAGCGRAPRPRCGPAPRSPNVSSRSRTLRPVGRRPRPRRRRRLGRDARPVPAPRPMVDTRQTRQRRHRRHHRAQTGAARSGDGPDGAACEERARVEDGTTATLSHVDRRRRRDADAGRAPRGTRDQVRHRVTTAKCRRAATPAASL